MIKIQGTFLTGNSMIDNLKTGGLNMLIGMGTVFLILIIIIILLSFFKIIPYLENKKARRSYETVETVDNVISQIAEQEQEELVDDGELAAVITAAIYAALGDAVPADGLIVRSIRKVNSRRRSIA